MGPLSLNVDLSLQCPIEGAVRRQWLRVTSSGSALPTNTSSSVLTFEEFSAADQGYYFCEGTGGGTHSEETAATKPVLLILKGTVCIVISISQTYLFHAEVRTT